MKAATAKTRTRFENILFATDFSPAAAHAIPFVKAVAHHFQSNLVVHVSTNNFYLQLLAVRNPIAPI